MPVVSVRAASSSCLRCVLVRPLLLSARLAGGRLWPPLRVVVESPPAGQCAWRAGWPSVCSRASPARMRRRQTGHVLEYLATISVMLGSRRCHAAGAAVPARALAIPVDDHALEFGE